MNEPETRSDVTLRVPATTAFLRHVRVLTATVADDCGMDVEAIEALRIAVDELCALAVGDAADGAQLDITLRATPSGVELEGRCGPLDDEPVVDPIAAQLLRAGSEHHELRMDGDHCVLRLRAERADLTSANGS